MIIISWLMLWYGLLVIVPCVVDGVVYTPSPYVMPTKIRVHTQPSDGTGGSPLPEQPCVVFLDERDRLVDTSANSAFDGKYLTASFEVSKLPLEARFAMLLEEGNEMGTPSALIQGGWANFTGLKVNELADGFRIKFISLDFGFQTESSAFAVTLGDPYELTIIQEVGTATGGVEFKPQPVVGVVDRGGNVISWLQEGTITVSICQVADGYGCTPNPGGSLLLKSVSSALSVDIIDGRAIFSGLAIDKAGYPYQLLFQSTYSGVPQSVVVSRNFTVGIGRVVEIRVEQPVGGARGGIPFTQQPIVSVRDAGGNIVTEDALSPPYSEVQLYLSNNPTIALLSSNLNQSRSLGLDDGYATGLDFKIDKIGQGYQIRFTAIMRTVSGEEYSLYVDSDPFDVALGDPAALQIGREIGGAYAGGLPFYYQPIVHLVDGGGNVFDEESTAQVHASLVYSPNGFELFGEKIATFFKGTARFRSLKLVQVGYGYVIQFSSTVNAQNLLVNMSFDVLPSTEFEAGPNDPESEDRFGHSLSIFDDTLVTGAPMEDLIVKEVQRITALVDDDATLQNEVQRIQTVGTHRVEVQQITSCGYGGSSAKLDGYFTLTFKGKTSRPLRYDIHPSVMKSYLETDIPEMGTLTVEKIIWTECDSDNNYRWTVFFNTLEGDIPQMTVNYVGKVTMQSPDPTTFRYSATEFQGMESASNAHGATGVSVTVETITESPVIGGTFKLVVGGDGTQLGKSIAVQETVDLAYDISALDLKARIEAAVRSISNADHFQSIYNTFNLVDVTRSGPDKQRGYTWDITFPASASGVYDWLQITGDETNLSGLGARVKTSTLVQGKSPLEGNFRLWFRGAGPTPLIDFDESAGGMESKLEALDTITDVEVSRSSESHGGYVWTVTFHETKSLGEYGYTDDKPMNLPALQADTFMLRGSGAQVLVEFRFADDMDAYMCSLSLESSASYDENKEPENCVLQSTHQFLLPEDMPTLGKQGHETGAAYVMYRDVDEEQWLQAAKLRGSDSAPYDHFGWSVGYDNSTTSENTQTGVIVVGAPHAAYKGSLESQSIVCNADSGHFYLRFRSQLSGLIEYDITAPDLEAALEAIPTITDVTVTYYLGGLEQANELASNSGHTLCQPVGGPANAQIHVLITFLYPNEGDLPLIEGLVTDPIITTTALLIDSTADPGMNNIRFGKLEIAEHVKGTFLGKGAGDDGYNTGAAYVFLPVQPGGGDPESATNGWVEDAKLLPSDGVAGDEFGFAVAVYIDCIVIGAPRHDFDHQGLHRIDGAGAVYIFTRDGQGGGEVGVWTETQKLTPPDRASNDFFGSVITIRGTTMVIASPGRNGNSGKVYIYRRQALSLPFSLDQSFTAPDVKPGDRFGSSLALYGQTLIIGAENADGTAQNSGSGFDSDTFIFGADYHSKQARVKTNGEGLINSGAVYSYTRLTMFNSFTFHQRLTPRSPRAYGRFGHSVTLERDLLLVAEHEEYNGPLTSRRYIYKIRTFVDEGSEEAGTIGNLFALTWRMKKLDQVAEERIRMSRFSADRYKGEGIFTTQYTDQFEPFQTLWMKHDVSAAEMQARIDRDLNAGDIIVTRTAPDANEGYTWLVTFVELSADGGKAGTIPLLGAVSKLSGGGKIEVSLIQEPMPYVHGMVHLFKRSPEETGDWSEHAILRPEIHQDGDLFGNVVQMRGRYAAVGAPNRDAFDTTGVNSGAVYVFDLGFVNVKFANQEYTVSEDAGTIDIDVTRCEPDCSVARAPTPGPKPGDFGIAETNVVQFVLSDGTARSRLDCTLDSVNTEECLWIDADTHEWDVNKRIPEKFVDIPSFISDFTPPGRKLPYYTPSASSTYSPSVTGDSIYHRYDFRAQSDYAPRGGQLEFGSNEKLKQFDVVITNDHVNEKPDETINLLLFSAGMRPLPGGDYWSVLTIEDDGDGGVGTSDTYEKMYATEPTNFARYGSATSADGSIVVVGAPFEKGPGDEIDAGGVYVYRHTLSGVWELEQHIKSPNITVGGRFGLSLQNRAFPVHRLIVGAPGESPPAAYIFLRMADSGQDPDPKYGTGSWVLEAYLPLDPVTVFDPRCDPDNSGATRRCHNDHHPIDKDSFYAGFNGVALYNNFAVVAAKGLESVFLYRLKRQFMWYYFQILKSSDYSDEVYPPLSSEHSKVYVKRPLFGSSVTIYENTLVVGATLAENDIYKEPNKPTDQTAGGLTCTDAGFLVNSNSADTVIYKGTVNKYRNAYLWSLANATEREKAYLYNDNQTFASEVSCEETNAFMLTMRSNGIPNHPVGIFPLHTDTLFANQADNPNGISEQSHVFHIPRFPNVTAVNPQSVLENSDALPQGPIGFALNGVPFLNPITKDGDDTVQVHSISYSGNIPDLCNGGPMSNDDDKKNRIKNMYGYRSNPICLFDQPTELAGSVPQLQTGKLFPFVYEQDGVTNPNPGQRSPKIGYALDGFPIYGPFDENGNLPSDLDQCNGRFDTVLGHYVYHITPWKAPYIIGCFKGKLTIDTPYVTNPFPEFSPFSNKPRDLNFHGRGAAYVFMLEDLNGQPFSPATINGMDIAPQPDPFDDLAPTDAWFEKTKLTPSDPERGDRFGHALALKRDQLLVSAFMDTARPRSTWDFEKGDLRGWTKTGTAFDNQPTYGDNTAHRNTYGEILVDKFRDYQAKTYVGSSNRVGKKLDIANYIQGWPRTVLYGPTSTHVDHPQSMTLDPHELREAMWAFSPSPPKSCHHKGKFWIGTYENRPATYVNGEFVPDEVEGNVVGDAPQGTLTSDVFIIYGTKMSFLIGGGCDLAKVYVELIVDGIPVRKVTGKCDEAMERVTWDVEMYRYQAAMIRIVDMSSTRWGHINVDDFRFNWDPSYHSRSHTPANDGSERSEPGGSGPMMYSGEPMAGAVYAFRRRSGTVGLEDHPCEVTCDLNGCFYLNNPPDRSSCVWEEQQKLQPSDRRAFEKFGYSVDLDDNTGLAIIGAVDGRAVDPYNKDDLGGRTHVGALYVFKREPEVRSEFGTLLRKPYWLPTELFKLQHPDKAESRRSQLGFSVAIHEYTIVAGAPGQASLGPIGEDDAGTSFNAGTIRGYPEGGATYFFDGSLANVQFKQKEYVVKESHQTLPSEFNRVIIKVQRTGTDLNRTVHVAYYTSDLTAHGVSEAKAAYCRTLPHTQRGQAMCGDYVFQSGVLTFNPEDEEVEFELRTMNDNCNEHYSEYVRLQLGIPGGPPLIGDQYVAVLRIDDDDQDQTVNRLFCPQPSNFVSETHPQYAEAERPETIGTPAQKYPLKLNENAKWILEKM